LSQFFDDEVNDASYEQISEQIKAIDSQHGIKVKDLSNMLRKERYSQYIHFGLGGASIAIAILIVCLWCYLCVLRKEGVCYPGRLFPANRMNEQGTVYEKKRMLAQQHARRARSRAPTPAVSRQNMQLEFDEFDLHHDP
jgi:hypothetical protein